MVRAVLWTSILFVGGCWGRGDTGQRPQETDDTVDTGVGCTSGFCVQGVAWDLDANVPAPEGLCIHVADPTNALIGMDIEILRSSVVGPDGEFGIYGIPMSDRPDVGLLMLVADCDGDPETVVRTSSGISSDDYADLSSGDIIEDRIAYVITTTFRDKIAADFVTAGYSSDDLSAGFVVGRVTDAVGNPLSDATVAAACTQCVPSYYFDTDPSDGWFTTGATPNTSTSADARGLWANPVPAIANYDATHPTETFNTQLYGSVSGNAGFLSLIAQ